MNFLLKICHVIAMTSVIDVKLRYLFNELKTTGLYNDTILIFTSDVSPVDVYVT